MFQEPGAAAARKTAPQCQPHSLPPQSPAVVDAPLRMVLQVVTPPRCTIRPTGTAVSVNAVLNISLVPAGQPAVQLSSMSMVSALPS